MTAPVTSQQSKIHGVLFDLDGTLLDTAPDLGHALNHVLKEHGLPPCSLEQSRSLASDGALAMLEFGFAETFTTKDPASLHQAFLDYYQQYICLDTRCFAGVETLLQRFNQQVVPWGIVTNKPGWLTERLLPHFSEFAQAKAVVSGDTLAHAKPHPAPMLLAAQQLGVSPEHILYVGDAKRDMQAARAAGMRSVFAEYGYTPSSHIAPDWPVDHRIQHPVEILTLC